MKRFFSNIVIAVKDIINAVKFRNHMKSLELMEDEEFTNLDLHTNWLGNVVYTQVNFTDRELVDADYSIHTMVLKKMQSYVDFFNKHSWSEYLYPQVSNLQEDDGNITLTYMFLFVYKPIVFTFWKLIKFLIGLGILGTCIYYGIWYIGTFI